MWERVAEWEELKKTIDPKVLEEISKKIEDCLLYTSDAADDTR